MTWNGCRDNQDRIHSSRLQMKDLHPETDARKESPMPVPLLFPEYDNRFRGQYSRPPVQKHSCFQTIHQRFAERIQHQEIWKLPWNMTVWDKFAMHTANRECPSHHWHDEDRFEDQQAEDFRLLFLRNGRSHPAAGSLIRNSQPCARRNRRPNGDLQLHDTNDKRNLSCPRENIHVCHCTSEHLYQYLYPNRKKVPNTASRSHLFRDA